MTKSERDVVRKRLEGLGLWSAFVKIRDGYIGDDHPLDTAFELAWGDLRVQAEGLEAGIRAREEALEYSEGCSQGKVITDKAMIDWVVANLERSDLKPCDCPNDVTWNLYLWATLTPGNKQSFMRDIFTKTLQTKVDYEERERVQAIERTDAELIGALRGGVEEFRRFTILSSGTQKYGGEH